jgi:hypothetical protein
MSYNAAKVAKSFTATNAMKLSDKQHAIYVEALAKLLAEAYSEGYRKGHEAAEYSDTK